MGACAGEGEYVAFAGDCLCEGPVEIWLQTVVESMRNAIATEFKAAIPTYDERPRIKWIFDYSCQNTIVVSRLYFTAAINQAFNEIEEGNEGALKVQLPHCCMLHMSAKPYTSLTWHIIPACEVLSYMSCSWPGPCVMFYFVMMAAASTASAPASGTSQIGTCCCMDLALELRPGLHGRASMSTRWHSWWS